MLKIDIGIAAKEVLKGKRSMSVLEIAAKVNKDRKVFTEVATMKRRLLNSEHSIYVVVRKKTFLRPQNISKIHKLGDN